jgi:hypothetical protein
MTVRRLLSILSISAVASVTVVAAQPKKPAPTGDAKPAPAAAPAPDAGSAAGSAVSLPEDPPPKDWEGKDENPGAPGGIGVEEPTKVVATPATKKAGYPIEEALRPINLPANMSEVAIGPHAQLDPYAGSDALRARYGITRKVQLGLTYLLGGIYDDPATPAVMDDSVGFHSGKAVGLDLTVLLKDWVGVRVGVPVYIKPVAVSITVGVPMKFILSEKFAVGGLDDLLSIKVKRFAPTFYQEAINASNVELDKTTSTQSNGALRISGFGVYNYKPKVAFIGRLGFNMEDFAASSTNTDAANGGLTYFLRAGVSYTPRKYIDLGLSLGFDDLAKSGSFGPAGLVAFRI